MKAGYKFPGGILPFHNSYTSNEFLLFKVTIFWQRRDREFNPLPMQNMNFFCTQFVMVIFFQVYPRLYP